MTDIKQLIERARYAEHVLDERVITLLDELADALERLTQPVGVEPVARVISTNSDKRKTISLVQGVHEYNTNFYSAETVARLQAEKAQLQAERDELVSRLKAIDKETYSHVDGRDLFAQLHPRNTLDIKRRVDGRETWFEGDWLSNLYSEIKKARAVLADIERSDS